MRIPQMCHPASYPAVKFPALNNNYLAQPTFKQPFPKMSPSDVLQELDTSMLCAGCCRTLLLDDDSGDLLESTDDSGRPTLRYEGAESPWTYRYDYDSGIWPELAHFNNSLLKGCGFCCFLYKVLRSGEVRDNVRATPGYSPDRENQGQISLRIGSRLGWGIMDEERESSSNSPGLECVVVSLEFSGLERHLYLVFETLAVPEYRSTAQWLGIAPPVSQYYLTDDSVEWMQEQLAECSSSHRHGLESDGFVPVRLLDVTAEAPRLVLRDEISCDGVPRYAALSYCWGSADDAKLQLKTTLDTLKRWRRSLPSDSMTEVLRDAITVARALSIPYLWVDALCILQDDATDWAKQCVDMCKVYGNAHVTISAASSRSCREGFLQQRGARARVPFQSTRRPSASGVYDLRFEYCGNFVPVPISDARKLHMDVSYSRWATRGWVFQERAAGTRILLFGKSSMHFCCDSSCATFPLNQTSGRLYFSLTTLRTPDTAADPSTIWNSMTSGFAIYQEDSFTSATDILPALSGLASRFNEILKDEYCAGHWRRTLCRSLMWRVESAIPTRKDAFFSNLSRRTMVPSWSVLTKGDIYQGIDSIYGLHQDEVESITPSIKLASTNPYGAISRGHLMIRSLALDPLALGIELFEPHVPSPTSARHFISTHTTINYEGRAVGKLVLDFSYMPGMEGEDPEQHVAGIKGDIASFKFLLLGSCRVGKPFKRDQGFRKGRAAYGLVLYPAPGVDSFYRVGVFMPPVANTHKEGLRLFRRLGKLETVTIV